MQLKYSNLWMLKQNSPEKVYETLEKVFRSESNQTLARFKLRNMKQNSGQSCDTYMFHYVWLCKNVNICMTLMSYSRVNYSVVYIIGESKTICLVNFWKRTIVSMHSMKLTELNLNWNNVNVGSHYSRLCLC